MELWGDPAVTALIDSRGKLSNEQVQEKLHAEMERERSTGLQYWALFNQSTGEFVGCGGFRSWAYTPDESNLELGFHLVKRCWGKGLATEAALGILDHGWGKLQLSKVTLDTIPIIGPRRESSRNSDSRSFRMYITSQRA